MKLKLIAQIAMVMFVTALATVTGLSQTSFFSDTFNNGSTVNSNAPAAPTINSASYEVITCAATTNNPNPPTITPGNFVFGCGSTSSGVSEMQAMFSSTPINLTSNSDYITMVIVFTNQSLNTASRAYLAVGLYNTGAPTNFPVAGGMNGTETSASTGNALNGAQLWQGYFGQQTYSANKNEITARQAQSGVDNTSQELLTTGSGTYSFQHPTGPEVGSSVTVGANATMTSATYTEVFTITLVSPTSLAITNWLYAGANTNSGILVTNMGGVASGSTFLTTSFNALAMGWYQKVATTLPNIVGIESINIFGQSTLITGPPTITAQPTNAIAVTNSFAQFFTTAVGADVTYQWYLGNAPLANAGNYSGVNTGTLTVSPAAATNAATALNGYSCLITGALGFTTNTVINALTLVSETNLLWTGNASANWDVDNSVNWETNPPTTAFASVFTPGDPVNFTDAGDNSSGENNVALIGSVAPASVYVATSSSYEFSGTGSIVGPASAVFDGLNTSGGLGGEMILNANNAYTGGTLFTNGIYVDLENYGGLGTGPVILGSAGSEMETTTAGAATTGVIGTIDVVSNCEFLIDGAGSFATVFLGDLSGSSAATLTLEPASAGNPTGAVLGNNSGSTNFYRVYGISTVCNANIFIDGPATSQAQYNGDVLAFYNASGSQTYNGVISGNGGIIVRGGGNDILNGQNTYTGGTTPTTGTLGIGASSQGGTGSSVTSGPLGKGALLVAPEAGGTTGTGIIFSSGGSNNIGNSLVYPSGTNNLVLEISGSNNLTFSGPVALNPIDGINTISNHIIQVVNSGLTKFSGNITDSGVGASLGFYGATNGLVALSGADSYIGMTGITNIAMRVDGTLSTTAVIATNGGTLGGSGSITAPVTIQSGGNLAAGDGAPGTLTVNGAVTFQAGSTNIAYVSGSSGNSKVTGVSSITYAGTLAPVVTSGTITNGQTFTLFSAASPSGNFTATNGTPGAGMTWYFNPTTGVLTAIGPSIIVPNVPPHITSFSLSGNNVSITATNGVNGGTYYLLGSANVALPLNQWTPEATNVVTASGSTESFSITDSVPAGSALFLILSSTNN